MRQEDLKIDQSGAENGPNTALNTISRAFNGPVGAFCRLSRPDPSTDASDEKRHVYQGKAQGFGLSVAKILAQDWPRFSENAHKIVFNKLKPATNDRIDYALLVLRDNDPVGYVTARELDHESVYWQFGGGFPWVLKSVMMIRMIEKAIEHEKVNGRKRIAIRVKNSNIPMLKVALAKGWLILGTLTYQGDCLVEMIKDL